MTVMRYAELDELKPIYAYSPFAATSSLTFVRTHCAVASRTSSASMRTAWSSPSSSTASVLAWALRYSHKSIMLHQIVNRNQFNGSGGRVFDRFFEEIVVPSGGDLYLTVRSENTNACAFYEGTG